MERPLNVACVIGSKTIIHSFSKTFGIMNVGHIHKKCTILLKQQWRVEWSVGWSVPQQRNWMVAGSSSVRFSVEFLSMSESTQTLQANPSFVKRCSCVVLSLQEGRKDLTHRHPTLSLFLSLCPQMMLKAFFLGGGLSSQGVHWVDCEIQSNLY